MTDKKAKQLMESFKAGLNNVRFNDLKKLVEHYFGEGSSTGSHFIWSTGIEGNPLVNIQNDKGKAKPYQVRQVLKLIESIEATKEEKKDGK